MKLALSELKNAVFQGDYAFIDKWFEENELTPGHPELDKVCHDIINQSYFYSFQCLSTDVREYKVQSQKRYLAIIKHFELNEQIKLMWNLCVHDGQDIACLIPTLDYSSKDNLKNKSYLGQIVATLFENQKFEQIEKLKENFNQDILEIHLNHTRLYYKTKGSSGSFMVEVPPLTFLPFENIIFNFTMEKKNYLENFNYLVPPFERVNEIMENLKTMKNKPSHMDMNLIYQRVELYTQSIFHDHLEKNMVEKDKQKKLKL